MTPAGRKLARSLAGTQAYEAPPAGTLKEWHWRAIAKAYAAGDEGLEGS
jgi:surface antigen